MSDNVKRIINCGIITSVWKGDYDDTATYRWKCLVRYDHKLWYHSSKDMTTGIKPELNSLIWSLWSTDGNDFILYRINFELQVNNWKEIIGSKYNYEYTLENEMIREDDQAIVNFTSNYESQVVPAAIWSQCEVGSGYIKLFCKNKPTDNILGTITLTTNGRFVQ